VENKAEATMYIKSRGRVGTGDIGDSPDGTVESNKWYRLIFSAKFGEGGFYNYYMNGELLKANNAPGIDNGRHTLDPAGVLFFTDALPSEGGDGSLDENDLYVAEIAIWDRALTEAEVIMLGMFDTGSNE
jgi:hypothetical protein